MAIQPVQDSSMPAVTPESSGLSEQQMQAVARSVAYAAAGALTIFAGVFLLAFPPAGALALIAGLSVYYGLIGAITFGPGIFEGSGDRGQRIDSVRDRALGGNPVDRSGPVNQSQGGGSVPSSQLDSAEGSGSRSESSSQNAPLSSGTSSSSDEFGFDLDIALKIVASTDISMEVFEKKSPENPPTVSVTSSPAESSKVKATPKIVDAVDNEPIPLEDLKEILSDFEVDGMPKPLQLLLQYQPAGRKKPNRNQWEEAVRGYIEENSDKFAKYRKKTASETPANSSESSLPVDPSSSLQKIPDSSPKKRKPRKMPGYENGVPKVAPERSITTPIPSCSNPPVIIKSERPTAEAPSQTSMISREEFAKLFPEIDDEELDEETLKAFQRMAVYPHRREEIRQALQTDSRYSNARRFVSPSVIVPAVIDLLSKVDRESYVSDAKVSLESDLSGGTPDQPGSSQLVAKSTPSILGNSSLAPEAPEDFPGQLEKSVVLAMPRKDFEAYVGGAMFAQILERDFDVETLEDLKRALPHIDVDRLPKDHQNRLLKLKKAKAIREFVNRWISTYNATTGKTTLMFFATYLKPEYKSYIHHLREEYQARRNSAKSQVTSL